MEVKDMKKGKYTKRDFQLAYRWMFAETLSKGAEVWKNSSAEYCDSVVEAYRNNFRNSFYTD
jgi:hypothetical protein